MPCALTSSVAKLAVPSSFVTRPRHDRPCRLPLDPAQRWHSPFAEDLLTAEIVPANHWAPVPTTPYSLTVSTRSNSLLAHERPGMSHPPEDCVKAAAKLAERPKALCRAETTHKAVRKTPGPTCSD
jgi:hypothetical protein